MELKEYYSFTFIVDNMGIIIESSSKIEAINKFSEEYSYLFNKQWTITQNNRCHKKNEVEEDYL